MSADSDVSMCRHVDFTVVVATFSSRVRVLARLALTTVDSVDQQLPSFSRSCLV